MQLLYEPINKQTCFSSANVKELWESSYFKLRSIKGYSLTEWAIESETTDNLEFKINSNQNKVVALIRLCQKDAMTRKYKLQFLVLENKQIDYISNSIIQFCNQLNIFENIQRAYTYIYKEETILEKTLKKAGFQKEAHLKNHSFSKGKFQDLLIYGKLLGNT